MTIPLDEALSHRVDRDITYSSVPGFRPLSLDLHLPADSGSSPVVLFLHGGGWMMGSRRQFCFFPATETFGRLVEEGWAVVATDYRLSGEATFPAQLDDAAAALAWIRENAARYGLDAELIVAWGESAGGQLAALLGLDPTTGLRGVIDWYAPTDLSSVPAAPTPAGPPTREARLLGGDPTDLGDLTRSASPLYQVTASAPPFFIAHGLDDVAIPPSQSQRLATALNEAGVAADLQLVPGAGHIWSGLQEPAVVMDPAIGFLRRFRD